MMVIDLSAELTHKMSVYPGDPEVDIVEIHKLEKEGWNLRQMILTTHIGTHVNVPYHMVTNGNKLEKYSLDSFMGQSIIFHKDIAFDNQTGIIFRDKNIDENIANMLIANPPKFVGLSAKFEFDIALEKLLLEHNIISFENLVNTESLPEKFMFYGVPLNIPGSDGSPVRAFATTQ